MQVKYSYNSFKDINHEINVTIAKTLKFTLCTVNFDSQIDVFLTHFH